MGRTSETTADGTSDSKRQKESYRGRRASMAKWRSLAEYTPFAQLLVEYMWEQRPPLLPNQFAERMGVRKQALSTWLNTDAVPAPQVVVRLARGMGRPVRELMTAAGFAPADDPLLDITDAWEYVLHEIQRALGVDAEKKAESETWHDVDGTNVPGVATETAAPALPETREALFVLLRQLQARMLPTTKASIRAPADRSLASKPDAAASEVLDSGNEATHEYT
jgi:transcriptional regulator with XRE-family HTH domain